MDALGYAKLAQAAYSSTPTIGVDGNSRAVLTHTDDGLVVSIPGTDNIACVLADLDVDVVQINGLGGLHHGFWDAFYDMSVPLMAEAPQVVTGHSLGAAIALVYAAYLCLAGKPPKAVYAFEPPRASIDPTLGQVLSAHGVLLRLYQNGNDAVPMIPRILHNWQHPAPLIALGVGAEYSKFPNLVDHEIQRVIDALTPVRVSQLRG